MHRHFKPFSNQRVKEYHIVMIKRLTTVFGVILVLLGLLGFVSNPLIGENAIFASDAMHNVIHALLGAVLLIVASWSSARADLWLKIIGAVLFLLGIIGLFTVPAVGGILLGIAYTNSAYSWFHVVVGAAMFTAGVYGK